MRVLIADVLPGPHIAALQQRHDVSYVPSATPEQLGALSRAHGAEALVVRGTRVTAAAIEQARDALRLIIRAGAGTDTIAVEEAAAAGIEVRNTPGRNAAAVAELACALLLAIDRRLIGQVEDLRRGDWRKSHYQKDVRGIAGRSVAIVGTGAIGLAVAQRLAAFGCSLATLRRPRNATVEHRLRQLDVHQFDDLASLAQACDVVSFHLPLTDATRGIIGAGFVEHLQPEAIVLNTSRGGLIDEAAVIPALDAKPLWLGLDVYPCEPAGGQATIDCALAAHPRVVGTHHVGASTQQAQHAVADAVVELLAAQAPDRREAPEAAWQ